MTKVKKRKFSPQEILELQEMQRLINARNFEAVQIKSNTAFVPRGQEIVKELEATVNLLENVKNRWVSQKLVECGYEEGTKCDINFYDGSIILHKN